MYTDINTTVTDSDRNVFQQLMDRAYDRWQKYDDEVKVKREQFRKDCLALCPIDGDAFQGTLRYQHNGEYITDYAMDDLVWKTFPTLDLDGFDASCDKLEIVAVILGNFNYQILGNFNYQTENGGISRWRYNGYAKAARGRVKTFLKRIGTPTCLKVIELLERARGDYLSDVSSTQFYKINNQMIADINAWLTEQVNKANAAKSKKPRQPRPVKIVLEGSTYFVRYVSRRKNTRHSAAQFYAPDCTLEYVREYIQKRKDLVLAESDHWATDEMMAVTSTANVGTEVNS